MRRALPVFASRSAIHESPVPRPAGWGEERLPPLEDARGRRYDYARFSVTDRCDLACIYCMPAGGEVDHGLRAELLDFEEAARLARVLEASGIRRIRLTGGEPLVRRDVVRLIGAIAAATRFTLAMTTNGTRLTELARPLYRAGLSVVNVSVDSLRADRFRRITRGGELARVLAGIHAALEAGLEVKVNTVVLRGENDDELGRIVDWAFELGMTPRFIELMPLGEAKKLSASAFMPMREVVDRLGPRVREGEARSVPGHGPARYLAAADGSDRRVGLITAMSDKFCGDCNRIRITARGDVRACLASRRAISLRDVMRTGGTDEDLAFAVHVALGTKEAGHFFLDEAIREHEHVGMSLIGG